MNRLARYVREHGHIPLAWAGATMQMDYLNLGDALSPVMVALLSGRPVQRVPFSSHRVRLGAVGTIGNHFSGGDVFFWGTGASRFIRPPKQGTEREIFRVPPDTTFHVSATRGPISARILGDGIPATRTFGDPVWLLPRFYSPRVEKKYELGVILHLSELEDRSYEVRPLAAAKRYTVPAGMKRAVKLINTITPIGNAGMRDRLDEILACKRIVSTSLHGLVIAETYGIPCLYFPRMAGDPGVREFLLEDDNAIDLRMADLYLGLGRDRLWAYAQPLGRPTNWDRLIKAVDEHWSPVKLDEERMMSAFPLDLAPVPMPQEGTIWDSALLNDITHQHNMAQLRADDVGIGNRENADALRNDGHAGEWQQLRPFAMLKTLREEGIRRRARIAVAQQMSETRLAVPLAWATTAAREKFVNFGDALSPLVVSAITGLPIARRASNDHDARLVCVGTIGHEIANGSPHFWGTGFNTRINPPQKTVDYALPPNTDFRIHAVRGKRSAALLRSLGLEVPDAYGDPGWFVPKLFPDAANHKTHDLGVVLHISELTEQNLSGQPLPEYIRYQIPKEYEGRIKLISTFAERSIDGIRAKIKDIASCRRIASVSLHGLVVAESFAIPSIWFGLAGPAGGREMKVEDESQRIDHRFRDFYSGVGRAVIRSYNQPRSGPTDWDALIDFIDKSWEQLEYTGRDLFDAFPLPLAVDFTDPVWRVESANVPVL